MRFKVLLNSIKLHTEMFKGRDKRNRLEKLRIYIPKDIENLNDFIIQYSDRWDNKLYEELQNFLMYLVYYSQKINSASPRNLREIDDCEGDIKRTIEEINIELDKLIKQIE